MLAVLVTGAWAQQLAGQGVKSGEAFAPALRASSALMAGTSASYPAANAAPSRGWRATSLQHMLAGPAKLESPRVFRAAEWLLVGTASFDYFETVRGLNHPPILHYTVVTADSASSVSVNFSSNYAEGGWAKVTGAHDPYGVVGANVGLDLLIVFAARHWARTAPPRWRWLATAALLAKSWGHILGGRSWMGYSHRLAAPYRGFNPVWMR